MAESIFKEWEDKLDELKRLYNDVNTNIADLKKDLYNLNYGAANKPRGKVIHDDHRLVLSAPEIIIGNVNLAGTLNPDGDSVIIIRGTNVSVEGSGAGGRVSTRATVISQTAENPGIDGTGHKVESASSVSTQGCRVTINSCDVQENGAFLDLEEAVKGSVSVKADGKISLSAQKSKKKSSEDVKAKTVSVGTQVASVEQSLGGNLGKFKAKREAFEKLLDEREKIYKGEEELRKDYNDLDELNLRINEKSQELANDFYGYLLEGGQLLELARQKKYFDELSQTLENINDNDFNNKTTGTSIDLNSERISITSIDGDQNMRTNKEAEVKISANSVKIEGVFDKNGSIKESSEFSVNTRKVELSTAGKKGVERDDKEDLKKADFTAEGDVVITSKNITMQAVNSVVDEGIFKENGLTADGTINLRAKNIGLSTVNSKDVEVSKEGKVTKATYTSEGDISILSKNVTMQSIDSKLDGDKKEETALTAGSKFSIRTENFAVSATDKEGKATGKVNINALSTDILSVDTDPKTGKAKDPAQKGSITISGENVVNHGKEKASYTSEKELIVLSKESALFHGEKTAEFKQDDSAHLILTGSNSELSGKKNTFKGETTANVLNSPSITVDNITVSKALKAPNFTDSVMVDTKNTSTSGSNLKGDIQKIVDSLKEKQNVASQTDEKTMEVNATMSSQDPSNSSKEEGLKTEKEGKQ